MFSAHPNTNFNFWITFILSSANAFNLDYSKILSFGKELSIVNKLPHKDIVDLLSLLAFSPQN